MLLLLFWYGYGCVRVRRVAKLTDFEATRLGDQNILIMSSQLDREDREEKIESTNREKKLSVFIVPKIIRYEHDTQRTSELGESKLHLAVNKTPPGGCAVTT